MNADLSSKLSQVIEQIPKDVLYDFLCSYVQSHEKLAMALVSEFCRTDFGCDMDEDTTNALFDEIDFHNNKVNCPMIEQTLSKLMKMVEGEMRMVQRKYRIK